MKKITLFLSAVLFTTTFTYAGEVFQSENIQQFQQTYDDETFDIHEGFEKLCHTLLHLMKTTGRIAAYCESKEHGNEPDKNQVINEAIPDLLIYALQIANLYDVDLGDKYDERLKTLKEKKK